MGSEQSSQCTELKVTETVNFDQETRLDPEKFPNAEKDFNIRVP